VSAFVYILRCADDSYYVGSTRASLDERVGSIMLDLSVAIRRDGAP